MTRYVRDPAYWGKPYGTPITPGMKPVGKPPKGVSARTFGTFVPSSRTVATTQPARSKFGKQTYSAEGEEGREGRVVRKTGSDGKPIYEAVVIVPGTFVADRQLFDTDDAAREHVRARVNAIRPKRRVKVANAPVVVPPAPFKRPHWRPRADGSFSRKQGDLHGVVTPIAHNGAFEATFFDGEIYKTHEFVDTGYVNRIVDPKTGAVGEYTIHLDVNARKEAALKWIDDQFNTPKAKHRLANPLSEDAKARRQGKINKAIKEGRVIPEMSHTDKRASTVARVALIAKGRTPRGKNVKVTHLRERTAIQREGMDWPHPWRNNKRKVFLAEVVHIFTPEEATLYDAKVGDDVVVLGDALGHIRRAKTGANDDGYSYYVDVPGEAPGTVDFHTDRQAAMYLRKKYEIANPPPARSSVSSSRRLRSIPIAPPFTNPSATLRTRGPGSGSVDDTIPADENMQASGYFYDKSDVYRDGRHIGKIRRVVTGKDRAGRKTFIYFADTNGKKPGTVKFDNDWEAARQLLREDRKGDGDRLLFPEFPMPEGYAAAPFLGPEISWSVRPEGGHNIALRTERIGHVKREKNGRWSVHPKREPALAAQHPSERRAAEVLVAYNAKVRAAWTAQNAAPTVVDVAPEPKPLRVRKKPGRFTVTDTPGGEPRTITAPSVILEEGAGLPQKTPPKKGLMPIQTAVDDFLNSGGLKNKPFKVRRSGTSSVVLNKPIPRGKQPVPWTMRDQYDMGAKDAVQMFERSTKVSKFVRDKLRRLEASGKYRWVHVDGKIENPDYDEATEKKKPLRDRKNPYLPGPLPNGEEGWVFVKYDSTQSDLTREISRSGGTQWDDIPSGSPVGAALPPVTPYEVEEILAVSQPEFDNYLYDPYRIDDAITEAERDLGDLLPRDQMDKGLLMDMDKIGAFLAKTEQLLTALEEKADTRHVRDSSFWGLPVGTPIKPGMKPQSGSTPAPKGSSPTPDATTPSGHPKPLKRVKIKTSGKKPMPKDDKSPSGHDKPKRGVSVGKDEDTTPKKTTDDAPIHEQRLEGIDTSTMPARDFTPEAAAARLRAVNPKGFDDGDGTVEKPINCHKDVEKAAKLMAEGKHVRLDSIKEVSILMAMFEEMNDEMRAKKDKEGELKLRQTYDLCKVHVKKVNLFCEQSKGIPRQHMPQFKGEPEDGSYAEASFDGKEANVQDEFFEMLDALGVGRRETTVNPTKLKATQTELVASQVSGMRGAIRRGEFKPGAIIVTRDGYVVDGHHTWAAQLGLDMEDDELDNLEMPIIELDADIGYIYDLAMGFTEMAGIKRKGAGKDATAQVGTKSLILNPDGTICLPCNGL